MDKLIVLHNTMCTKSRGLISILEEKGIPYEVRFYLKDPLTKKDLTTLMQQLDNPTELVRVKDAIKKGYLEEGTKLTPKLCLSLLTEHPELMERPVVMRGGKALIARPPELIENWL